VSDRHERSDLIAAKRVVVKIGSRLLAESPAGRPAAVADQVVELRKRGIEVVIVSSGAIAMGVRALRLDARPHDLPGLQAAAAVGQSRLMQHWEHAFAPHDLLIGQVLLTHDDLGDRRRFLSARLTLRALLDQNVVPIINENDTVAVEEIKFGDNDQLAALVSSLVSADALIILTDVDGVWDEHGKRIPVVRDVEREAAPVAGQSRTDGVGSGGMASKVQSAKMVTRLGIPAVVAPGRDPRVLIDVLAGVDRGTVFLPGSSANARPVSQRKHWIAYGPKPTGRLVVDNGARKALVEAGKSLLPRGITAVEGEFDAGETVSVIAADGTELARGLAAYDAAALRRIRGLHSSDFEATLGYRSLDEAIHRDDLVLL
jgi:glutamate 5-kinase